MKLAMVTHSRCGEWAATTYVMVPDEMKPSEFWAAVKKAQKAYQEFVDGWETHNPYQRRPVPEYNKYPDKTVAEVQEMHRLAQIEFEKWEKVDRKGYDTFLDYLLKEGDFKPIWDAELEGMVAEVHWGHQHGKRLQYGETDLSDLSGPKVRERL